MSKIHAKDDLITSVQFYNDRTDITHEFSVASLEEGTCKLQIVGLVDSTDLSTVRVRGNKFAQILEVTQD